MAVDQAGKQYFVSQSFRRGLNLFEPEKVPLLFSHYDDAGLAQIHLNAIPKNDKFRTIIDLKKPEHVKKINDMLTPDSSYVIYSSLYAYTHEDIQKLLDTKYIHNTARYIKSNTSWSLRNTEFHTQLEVIFGELYLTIKHNSQSVRTKFEDIENS